MDVLEKYVTRGKKTASRIWGKTAVVLLLPQNKADFANNIFELSPSCTYIWKLLENKPKIKDIVKRFAAKKRVSHKIAEKKVVKFIQKLAKKEIVEILDELQGQ